MTKPIILVKICSTIVSFKELKFENSFHKVTSWPQLISELLLIGLALFYAPGVSV